ncbi:MAG TPA: lamin tail domain-containing protein [Flavisolibacter sp.]
MKTAYLAGILLLCCAQSPAVLAQPPGRVVINEYMPWPANACNATSEFVELLNFGPGAVNIGCYILTNGTYSITIPQNTILLPGQYYVIAGQNTLPQACGNLDSAVQVNLNWNTCNCTNIPIPQTGEGFMEDGGNANVRLVLLDPSQIVVDAVSRELPSGTSPNITSSSGTGSCVSQTFSINNLNSYYETTNLSTGNANSFARKLDGDCGWVKTTKQSANATNNAPGNTSDVSYNFTILNASDCGGGSGSISITVRAGDYTGIFPMSYTIAKDADNNYLYNSADSFASGIAATPPNINISGLTAGQYRVTVASAKGCNLRSFDFSILTCYPVLPVKLMYFRNLGVIGDRVSLEWKVDINEQVRHMIVETSADGVTFREAGMLAGDGTPGSRRYSFNTTLNGSSYYRLRVIQADFSSFFSPVINVRNQPAPVRSWPNPVKDRLFVELVSGSTATGKVTVFNQLGALVMQEEARLKKGPAFFFLEVEKLLPGTYLLQVAVPGAEPISFRFVKH